MDTNVSQLSFSSWSMHVTLVSVVCPKYTRLGISRALLPWFPVLHYQALSPDFLYDLKNFFWKSLKSLNTVQISLFLNCLSIRCHITPGFPSKKDFLLCNQSTSIKIRKLTLIRNYCLILRSIQSLPVVLIMSFITAKGSSSASLTACSCQVSLSPPIWSSSSVFPWVLWSCYFWRLQAVFWRTFLYLGLSDVTSGLDSGSASLAGVLSWCALTDPVTWRRQRLAPFLVMFTLTSWVLWCLPGFFTVKFIFPPF